MTRSASLLDEMLGDGDRTERVDEFAGDDYELGSAVMAANSVSMFGDRIVVARNGGRFVAADVAPVIAYLDDPNPTSTLVLVWDRPVASGATQPQRAEEARRRGQGGQGRGARHGCARAGQGPSHVARRSPVGGRRAARRGRQGADRRATGRGRRTGRRTRHRARELVPRGGHAGRRRRDALPRRRRLGAAVGSHRCDRPGRRHHARSTSSIG